MTDNNNNNNMNIFESINRNNSKEPITEGRICFSRSFSNINHINLNSSNKKTLILNDSIKDKRLGQFIFEKRIGQGTFGKVILARDEMTKEKVAIKILNKEKIAKETDLSKLEREIRILKLLRHDNIVHLYNVIETNEYLYLIMEYIKGIELFDFINIRHYVNEAESCKFFQQIISGIEYLAKIKVVHRDLKPENLLISNNGTIKIVDFGLSNTYFDDNLLLTACGSPCYAAPEMVKGQEYSGVSVDIWSSGVVLYAMLCGCLPFEDNDNDVLYKKITEGKFVIPDFLSDDAVDFLHGLLNIDPQKRYNIQQIKNHPWFNQLNPKLNMSEGLLIKSVIVPIDENIISIMVNKYDFNEEEIKIDLILNEFNQITTVYYLILQKFIKEGKKTIGDMKSSMFEEYINDLKNKLSYYGNDFNLIINERVYGKKKERKKSENKKIRQISETKNLKKHYLIDFDLYSFKGEINKSTRIDSSLKNCKKYYYNIDNNPNIKNNLKYINNSSKKIINHLNEKINLKKWKDIYIKKSSKIKKNSRKNNLTLSFFKKDKNIVNNKLLINSNLYNLNSYKDKKSLNLYYNNKNSIKSNNINNNNGIDNTLHLKEKNNKNINKINDFNNSITGNFLSLSLTNEHKHRFSFNKKLLSMKKIINKDNSINNKIRNSDSINNNNNNDTIVYKDISNSVNTVSTIDNYQYYNSTYTPLNYNKTKIFTKRNNRMKLINNKYVKVKNNTNLNSTEFRIKVDKKFMANNSSNKNYINDLLLKQKNMVNNTFTSENYNPNKKIYKKSDFVYKKNNSKEKNYSINSLKIKLFSNSLLDKIKQKKDSNILNYKEPNIYKRIKIQKSPFSSQRISSNIEDKIYFKKKFIVRNKNPTQVQGLQDFSKKLFDTGSHFHDNKGKNNSKSLKYYLSTFKNAYEYTNRTICLTNNNSKKKVNNPYKFLKLNTMDDYSTIDNEQNMTKENMIINTMQPKYKFNKYFKKNNIAKRKILLNNISLNQSNNKENNVKRTINKSNIISFYNNLNNTIDNSNQYIVNYNYKNENNHSNKSRVKKINNYKNNTQVFKQPQLCITNINFYNYVNNAQPEQKIIPKNNLALHTSPNKEITKNKTSNNNKNKIKININKNNKAELLKTKNSILFDLNSISSISKNKNIKFLIIKELNLRKINYKTYCNNSDIKFVCYKNDIRFELNFFICEESLLKKFFVINAIKKQGNINKFKNLINKIISNIK